MKKLTEQDMKDLVSDYLFGDLNDYEKEIFESNIEYFPEIQKEIAEFRGAFEYVNKIKYEDNIMQRSKNISIKVQGRLNRTESKFVNFFKFFAPVISLLVLIILGKYYVSDEFIGNSLAAIGIYTDSYVKSENTDYYQENSNLSNINSKPKPIITLSDIAILVQKDSEFDANNDNNDKNENNNNNNTNLNYYTYQNLNEVIELIDGDNLIDNHFDNSYLHFKTNVNEAKLINDKILDNQSLNNSIAFDYMIASLNEDELTYLLNNF